MRYKELANADALLGKWVLLRQGSPYTRGITYLAGLLGRDSEGDLFLRDAGGRMTILAPPCKYGYIVLE